ncbi:hypothetical protein OCD85_01310 [Bacillus pacificus]|uniref:hypothetical protein n=1 Tax=Bacillus TaxID=1386 RepID=UPI00094548C5|nr:MULTISPECIES: hypothetical protein [Bacillus]MBD0728257.1 hypothetical protein [Bacillus cereus]MCC2485411.1 hypothetical protein [Bacillus pacificus]MCU4738988.1 hypothetical protein [Bacillus paranthracis]MCU4869134.1 hypothetical protein [Bacillus paranthracis]MCU5075056.1 hypothetical protein [Bacillus paranthracis]
MNLILEMFLGNLSLSVIFVTLLLLVGFYVVIKITIGQVDSKANGVVSFGLWYTLMGSFILIIVISFCVYVLHLQ